MGAGAEYADPRQPLERRAHVRPLNSGFAFAADGVDIRRAEERVLSTRRAGDDDLLDPASPLSHRRFGPVCTGIHSLRRRGPTAHDPWTEHDQRNAQDGDA